MTEDLFMFCNVVLNTPVRILFTLCIEEKRSRKTLYGGGMLTLCQKKKKNFTELQSLNPSYLSINSAQILTGFYLINPKSNKLQKYLLVLKVCLILAILACTYLKY